MAEGYIGTRQIRTGVTGDKILTIPPEIARVLGDRVVLYWDGAHLTIMGVHAPGDDPIAR